MRKRQVHDIVFLNMNNQSLTIEQRFERIDHQFDISDRRFERMEFRTNQRFEDIEDHLNRHDRQFLELKTSISDLAMMTKMEFDRVYERLDGIDKRFDEHDKQFIGIDKRLDTLEKQISDLIGLVKQGFGIA